MAADQKHQMHWDLIYALEARVDLVDDEIRVCSVSSSRPCSSPPKRMARVRKMLDSEAEARAAADANRRLHFRRTAAESDSDREMAVSVSVKSEHTKGSKTLKSIEHELDDRHISPVSTQSLYTSLLTQLCHSLRPNLQYLMTTLMTRTIFQKTTMKATTTLKSMSYRTTHP